MQNQGNSSSGGILKKLFTCVKRDFAGRETSQYHSRGAKSEFDRESSRRSTEQSRRSYDRKTAQYYASRINGRDSSESEDSNRVRYDRDQVRDSDQDSTDARRFTNQQFRPNKVHKFRGERYDAMKIKSAALSHVYARTAATQAQPEKNYAREMQRCLDYYKRLQTGNFECHVCGSRLANRQCLIGHMDALHPGRNLPSYIRPVDKVIPRRIISKFMAKNCFVCDFDYPSHDELKLHFAKDHGIDIHTCSQPSCNRSFLHKKKLEDHETEAHTINVRIQFWSLFTISLLHSDRYLSMLISFQFSIKWMPIVIKQPPPSHQINCIAHGNIGILNNINQWKHNNLCKNSSFKNNFKSEKSNKNKRFAIRTDSYEIWNQFLTFKQSRIVNSKTNLGHQFRIRKYLYRVGDLQYFCISSYYDKFGSNISSRPKYR